MNTTSVCLKFVDRNGTISYISIDSMLNNGYPIDSDAGDDLTLVDKNLYLRDGTKIE